MSYWAHALRLFLAEVADIHASLRHLMCRLGAQRGRTYWRRAWFAVIVGMVVGEILSAQHYFLSVRYRLYDGLAHLMPEREPMWTVIVLIGDDEYWKGRLAGRVPIKRDYLAGLLRRVASCDPEAIALDFDLRSPATDGSLADNPVYADETRALIAAIKTASSSSPIILPATLSEDARHVEPSVLDSIPDRPGEVQRGTINLPFDYREIPTTQALEHGPPILSLALVAADLVHPGLARKFLVVGDEFPFGSLDRQGQFTTYYYRESNGFSASECRTFRHRIVLIGAGWHRIAWRRGPLTDARDTPAGTMSAIYLHASYIEAFLGTRTFRRVNEAASIAAEGILSSCLALILAARSPWQTKVYRTLGMLICIAILTYLGAQNFGVFADFLSAAILLCIHAAYSYLETLEEYKKMVFSLPPLERERLEKMVQLR